jgi:hypothetical protein
MNIHNIKERFQGECLICGSYVELSYTDVTLGKLGICRDCAVSDARAELALKQAGIIDPPHYLTNSDEHRL